MATMLASAPAAHGADTPKKSDRWIIHEWGTFTSLQDESGKALGGINSDDEPVPKFVHRLSDSLLLTSSQLSATNQVKGIPRCNPQVTMRLETPVLYFHPPASQPTAVGIDVTAKFLGGWLSEYYPDAHADAPGFSSNSPIYGSLDAATVGTLAWKNLSVGGNWAGPATGEHVWTAPREVQSASVRSDSGESEKYLFYRGVGHIDAPLAVTQDAKAGELTLRSQLPPALNGNPKVRSLWLVDIRDDGTVAFRAAPSVTLAASGQTVGKIPSRFVPGDYSSQNLKKLKASMHDALVRDGLFDDEAAAMLNTWELSYFKSAGTRLFFLVPRAWTDNYLPLTVSVPSDITRVMVGRIELITPAQREILQKLWKISAPQNPASTNAVNTYSQADEHQLYLNLGRFRDALVANESTRHLPASSTP